MSLEVHIEKKLNGFTLRSDFTAGNTATAILGASGCGKSMPLRCIAGIVLDGRVLFDSEQHIDLPPQQRGVGLLFQNYALFPNMTVEQNILCGLKAERDKAARKARCAGMLRALRLEELASRRPAELSGGQQQRTALARILVGKPKILMLDEPFSALDSYLREEVEGEVGSLLAGFAGTALLVTHNRDEAYRLCRDMIVMDVRVCCTSPLRCRRAAPPWASAPTTSPPAPRAQRMPCRWSFSRPARTPSTGTSSSSCRTAPLVCGGK